MKPRYSLNRRLDSDYTPKGKKGQKMEKPPNPKDSIGAYAVQCYKCFKWRLIPSKEEFETIRESFNEDPWCCDKKGNDSCENPADINYDSTRIWVIDRPNLPKSPPETERLVIMRKDLSKMDIYYVMPNGKRARGASDVEKFLEANPEYRDKISVSDFSFITPKIAEETVSKESEWRVLMRNNKKLKAVS
ncbi:hypothetical protein LUZ60_003743 [Juncus effusus]|nr:hypothetical protein LUZ60_003743 [Juncus effusus]